MVSPQRECADTLGINSSMTVNLQKNIIRIRHIIVKKFIRSERTLEIIGPRTIG